MPPPPAYGPGPAQPSPVGAFLGRVLRGDWLSSAKAAVRPAGLLLVLATALAIPSYGQSHEVVVGWSDRLRIALALLMQGFGGGFELSAAGPSQLRPDGSDFGPGYGSDSGYGSDYGSDHGSGFGSGMEDFAQGAASLSLVPLTVTALWIAALWLGARTLRARGEGLEAAVRVSLLVTGVVLVLGLFAQPEILGVEVSSSPVLAALGALALSLAVSVGVLQRDALAGRLAQHPAALSAVRALGTAVRALCVVVALCSLVGFIVYANTDEVDGTALLIALPILPNIGFAVLGLSWGAPVEYNFRGSVGSLGSGAEGGTVGLGEISDEWGGGAVTGALALGVVCALTFGLWAARRSADRREQALTGAFALGLVLLLTGLSGASFELAGGLGDFGGSGTTAAAPSVPDMLLFGLLWLGGAVLLGPLLLRLVGAGSVAPGVAAFAPPPPAWPVPGLPPTGSAGPHPYAPAAPGSPAGPGAPAEAGSPAGSGSPADSGSPAGPGAPAGPGSVGAVPAPEGAPAEPAPVATPTAVDGGAALYAPGPYAPQPQPAAGPYNESAAQAHTPAPDGSGKSRAVVWAVTLTVAFVVGGGATAGVLMLKDRNEEQASPSLEVVERPGGSAHADPKASSSPSPTPPPASTPSTTPGPSEGAAGPSATPGGGGTALPVGFALRQDPAGFTVAVMEGWSRRQAGGQVFYEAPTGGEYLQIGIVENTPRSSYENFVGLEKKHLANSRSDYRRVRMEENTYQGRPGAIWEFTHIPEPDESDSRRHIIDQAFVAADGTEYAILAAGRADNWDAAKDQVFSTALSTFKAG
ncbi:hypothetical protein ACIQ7Q_00415 [Streptomyces sp. NPDC096176]|uniref:hypothetical protein n=1 Tax=Streptomyces sp. NPDC096176 TaxID=3366079 RepID=UPI003821EFE8